MTLPLGVYFVGFADPKEPVRFDAKQSRNEADALAEVQRHDARRRKLAGGCPAGSKAGGPYWAYAYITAVNYTDRPGAAWTCGYASETAAANAVIDYCQRTSCAKPQHYMTMVIGNVTENPMPKNQYHCADGHPNARAGSLGPRQGQGTRTRQQSVGEYTSVREDSLCSELVRKWAR